MLSSGRLVAHEDSSLVSGSRCLDCTNHKSHPAACLLIRVHPLPPLEELTSFLTA
jgi:hypothetical protein